jgi:hypothetical protein
VFEALGHRNFRLLWIGLLISSSGSLMQSGAILWHISLLVPDDRRALALGLAGLVRIAPVIVPNVSYRPVKHSRLVLTHTGNDRYAALEFARCRALQRIRPLSAHSCCGTCAISSP